MNANPINEPVRLLCKEDGRITAIDEVILSRLGASSTEAPDLTTLSRFESIIASPGLTESFAAFLRSPGARQQSSTSSLQFSFRRLRQDDGSSLILIDLQPLAAEAEDRRLADLGRLTAQFLHDLKNHLGGLKLFAGYLQKKFGQQPEIAEIGEKIQAGLQRMTEETMLVSQIARPMNLQSADLADLLAQAVKEIAPSTDDSQGRVKVEAAAGKSVVGQLEPALIRRALVTLLRRALSSIPSDGIVLARLRREENQCMIDLVDQSGVPSDHQAWLALSRHDPTARLSLDLLLARHIIANHHGRIEAAPTGNILLTVCLPLWEPGKD